nr:MAG TPA: hypothetical protein [Caudoviricetes sp.]
MKPRFHTMKDSSIRQVGINLLIIVETVMMRR